MGGANGKPDFSPLIACAIHFPILLGGGVYGKPLISELPFPGCPGGCGYQPLVSHWVLGIVVINPFSIQPTVMLEVAQPLGVGSLCL